LKESVPETVREENARGERQDQGARSKELKNGKHLPSVSRAGGFVLRADRQHRHDRPHWDSINRTNGIESFSSAIYFKPDLAYLRQKASDLP